MKAKNSITSASLFSSDSMPLKKNIISASFLPTIIKMNYAVKVNIKPLSVNQVWKGRRFKTSTYSSYEKALLAILPNYSVPIGFIELYLKFGFSNSASDWDNPVKPFQDILQKRYKFNDKMVRRAVVDTEKVAKGEEYIIFEIKPLK